MNNLTEFLAEVEQISIHRRQGLVSDKEAENKIIEVVLNRVAEVDENVVG